MGVCTALALRGGSNTLTIVTLRAFGTLAILLVYFRAAGVPFGLALRERKIATAVAIPLCVNTYCINEAINQIPVPLAILIFYLWPAIVTAVSWTSGAEPFRWRGAIGLVLAFLGIALALNVDLTAAEGLGALYALVAAFAWSAVFLLTHSFFRGRDTRPMILHMTGVSAIAFALAVLTAGAWQLPALPVGWIGVAGMTLFYALGTIGIFAATAIAGPMRVGFVMNFEPVATVVFSALILDQRLAPIQLAGAALVILALFLFRPPPRRVS